MNEIADLRRMLLRELDSFKQEINLFPDDDLLWVAPGGPPRGEAQRSPVAVRRNPCGRRQAGADQ